MLDRIDRIRQSFITRKAEQSDTDDHIESHDPDFFNKKQKHKKDNDWSDYEQDLADISVESLIVFLQGLIHDGRSVVSKTDTMVDPKMEQALNAYGKQDHKIDRRYTYLDHDDQQYNIETVLSLIDAFESIKERGVEHLTLEYAHEGFLQTLQKTVEKYSALF